MESALIAARDLGSGRGAIREPKPEEASGSSSFFVLSVTGAPSSYRKLLRSAK
jgi:hypothetical protein